LCCENINVFYLG